MQTKSPTNLKELMELLTPPKGVRGKFNDNANDAPVDEGDELFYCEDDEIPLREQIKENNEIENVDSDEEETKNRRA